MSKLVGIAALLATVGVASANWVELVPVNNYTAGFDPDYPGFDDVGWRTFDLVAHVDPDDDWTAASISLTLHGGVFFQHNVGNDYDPGVLVGFFHALAFDSFFDSPPEIINGHGPEGFAAGPDWTDTTVLAEWYDTVDTGGGSFILFRFTTDADLMYGGGYVTYQNSGGDMHPFSILPTPGTAAPLLLVGLACRRRR